MTENKLLKFLIAFVLGYFVARMMRGNGLSVGGRKHRHKPQTPTPPPGFIPGKTGPPSPTPPPGFIPGNTGPPRPPPPPPSPPFHPSGHGILHKIINQHKRRELGILGYCMPKDSQHEPFKYHTKTGCYLVSTEEKCDKHQSCKWNPPKQEICGLHPALKNMYGIPEDQDIKCASHHEIIDCNKDEMCQWKSCKDCDIVNKMREQCKSFSE